MRQPFEYSNGFVGRLKHMETFSSGTFTGSEKVGRGEFLSLSQNLFVFLGSFFSNKGKKILFPQQDKQFQIWNFMSHFFALIHKNIIIMPLPFSLCPWTIRGAHVTFAHLVCGKPCSQFLVRNIFFTYLSGFFTVFSWTVIIDAKAAPSPIVQGFANFVVNWPKVSSCTFFRAVVGNNLE